ncbi:MAG: hypothetical protein IOD15_12425 [Phycisphaerales bacterium]|nr:hypothetical protein [Phycisphaerales bacterium]
MSAAPVTPHAPAAPTPAPIAAALTAFHDEALAAMRLALATFSAVAKQLDTPALAQRAAASIVILLKSLPAIHTGLAQFTGQALPADVTPAPPHPRSRSAKPARAATLCATAGAPPATTPNAATSPHRGCLQSKDFPPDQGHPAFVAPGWMAPDRSPDSLPTPDEIAPYRYHPGILLNIAIAYDYADVRHTLLHKWVHDLGKGATEAEVLYAHEVYTRTGTCPPCGRWKPGSSTAPLADAFSTETDLDDDTGSDDEPGPAESSNPAAGSSPNDAPSRATAPAAANPATNANPPTPAVAHTPATRL